MIADSLARELNRRYGIGQVHACALLEGGYWNDVLRLETDRGAVVLRVNPPDTDPTGVTSQHALMGFMGQSIPAVAAPLRARDGSSWFVHDGRIATLFPFMAGQAADVTSRRERGLAAAMLAHLHQVGLTYPRPFVRPAFSPVAALNWDDNRMWSWSYISAFLAGTTGQSAASGDPAAGARIRTLRAESRLIAHARIALRDWVSALQASGRPLHFAPTHGDYWRNNLLVQEDSISAVLDWDECQSEWLVYELARALWEFCKDGEHAALNKDAARHFLTAYQAAGGPVPVADYDLLVPFIRCVRLFEVLFAIQHEPNFAADDYCLQNLRALENLRGMVIRV